MRRSSSPRIVLSAAAIAVLALTGYDRAAEPAVAGAAPASAANPQGAVGSPAENDLFAFASGARWVAKPDDVSYSDMAYTPYSLLDEATSTDWASIASPAPVFVLELPERTELTRIGFDSDGMNFDEKAAKSVKVEVSDTSAVAGFTTVLETRLEQARDAQDFTLSRPATGRWVRLTVLDNYGSEYSGMTGFRGYGRQLTHTAAMPDVSGTYEGASGWGVVHLKQVGTRVIGCYEYRDGVVAGGVAGNLLKLQMIEQVYGGGQENQLGLFAVSSDGRTLYGLTRAENSQIDGYNAWYSGEKISDDIGDCPGIPGWRQGAAVGSQLSGQLSQSGRARLDGVNFDFNAATLQAASRPLLDQVIQMLKDNPDWRVALEGHTDNIGGEAFNQTLSSARAETVRAYLQAGGIAPDRLTASGFGYGRPVASNDSQGGRAQNRRVEIVKR